MSDDDNKATYRHPESLADVTFDSNSKVKAFIAPFWADSRTEMNMSEV